MRLAMTPLFAFEPFTCCMGALLLTKGAAVAGAAVFGMGVAGVNFFRSLNEDEKDKKDKKDK